MVVTKEIFDKTDAQFTDLLAQTLGFSYKLLSASDGELGRSLPNGTWTGMVGMVERGEADFAISSLSLSEERFQVIDFSYPFNRIAITFATRWPEFTPQPESFLWPFSVRVWASVVAIFFIMPIIFYLLLSLRVSYQKLVLITLSTILRQSMDFHSSDIRDYLLLSCWKLGIMFLGYSYTAVLLAFLTIPPLEGVRTIPELAKAVVNGKYQCTGLPGSFVLFALLKSSDPNSRIIAQNMKLNNGSTDIDGVLGDLKSSKKPAFLIGEDYAIPFTEKYFISRDEFFPAMRAVGLRKDFCCKAQLNRVISYVWSSGIYQKLIKDAGFIESLKLKSNKGQENNARRLTFKDFGGAFILITFGHSLAMITFVFEFIIYKKRKRTPLNGRSSEEVKFGF